MGKGAALSYLMEIENISAENLMAIGDSPNDISMLDLSGTPVAVDNAEGPVKEAASYIAPSCYDDGVADAIYNFVL